MSDDLAMIAFPTVAELWCWLEYLQRFTPRRTRGTASLRNTTIAERLQAEGKMTEAGLRALGY